MLKILVVFLTRFFLQQKKLQTPNLAQVFVKAITNCGPSLDVLALVTCEIGGFEIYLFLGVFLPSITCRSEVTKSPNFEQIFDNSRSTFIPTGNTSSNVVWKK